MTDNEGKNRDPLLLRPFKWVGKTLVTGVLAAVLVSGFVFHATGWPPERIWDWTRWSIDHQTLSGQPTCDDPGWLRPVEIDSAIAFYLPDPNDHPVEQTFDDNRSTAWWQGWPESPGESRVAWVFGKPETVKLVCLIEGWARDVHTHKTTGRPRRIKLSSDTCKEKTLRLPNDVSPTGEVQGGAWGPVSIHFECNTERTQKYPPHVTLWIESIYPPVGAEDTQKTHVAISEIAFYG